MPIPIATSHFTEGRVLRGSDKVLAPGLFLLCSMALGSGLCLWASAQEGGSHWHLFQVKRCSFFSLDAAKSLGLESWIRSEDRQKTGLLGPYLRRSERLLRGAELGPEKKYSR